MKKIFLLLILAWAATGSALVAQTKTITGKVTSSDGKPIGSARVVVAGAQNETATMSDDTYAIKMPINKTTLVFSALGFIPDSVLVKDQPVINVQLKDMQNTLEEVVVVGYGTKRKMDLTGSTSSRTTQGQTNISGFYKQQQYPNTSYNREGYDHITDNRFLSVKDQPLSTFSIDVDAASYSNVRRMLNSNQFPQADAVRVEEMINYFSYSYPQPKNKDPFSVTTEAIKCPWNEAHQLVMIGLQAKKINYDELPPSNLIFLIDVSGSMFSSDKLPLVKSSLSLLTDQLRPQDKVAIVVYAGNAGLVLPSTPGNEKEKIKTAINALEAGGSTAGGRGIKLAYSVAKENFITKGNNRVILCTDGDFNVGVSSDGELERMIETERASGVYLTVLGYGTGNYQDAKMQKLADKGNGNHAYIDNLNEAKKVLVSEFGGTLFTIAKDVKLQVEFNPEKVKGYRLIGYENRLLNKEDFNDDKKDAGDMGSGHTVTALYEVIPAKVKTDKLAKVDTLRYQHNVVEIPRSSFSKELMYVKFRYNAPDAETSSLIEIPVSMDTKKGSDNIRFAAAVASFGMILRNSEFKGKSNYKLVKELASQVAQDSEDSYKKEFLELVSKAEHLDVVAKKGNGNMEEVGEEE